MAMMTRWLPVPISTKPMMMRKMSRWVSMPQIPIRMRMSPVDRTMPEIVTVPSDKRRSGSEPLDDNTQLTTHLHPEQDRQNRNRAGAKEGAELPERQHSIVQEAAGEDDAGDADEHDEKSGEGLHDAEISELDPVVWPGEQQEQDAGCHHRAALKSAAGAEMSVHHDIGGEDRNQGNENVGAVLNDLGRERRLQ